MIPVPLSLLLLWESCSSCCDRVHERKAAEVDCWGHTAAGAMTLDSGDGCEHGAGIAPTCVLSAAGGGRADGKQTTRTKLVG